MPVPEQAVTDLQTGHFMPRIGLSKVHSSLFLSVVGRQSNHPLALKEQSASGGSGTRRLDRENDRKAERRGNYPQRNMVRNFDDVAEQEPGAEKDENYRETDS